MPSHSPMHHPVLSLRLSHPNFLDAVLTSDGQPVYSLETQGNQTTMLRCNTLTDGLEDVATVMWPEYEQRRKSKDKDSGVTIHMHDASPISENDFLKLHTGVISASRKFHLPGQDRALRWKRIGGVFECTTPTSSLPIAHFEPAHSNSPAKLTVFIRDLHFQHNFRESQTCGVNTTLLDYLVLTSLLLVTHKDEWRSMPSANAAPGSSSSSSPVSPTSPVTPFSSSPSPISPPSSCDSWYRSPRSVTQSLPNHLLHSHSHSRSSTMTSTPVVRPPTHRPRTSPASSCSTSTSHINSINTHSIRRVASIYGRPQPPTMVDMETSPVLDIRPILPTPPSPPPVRARTRSSIPATAPLRLHVPTSPLPPTPSALARHSPVEVDPTLAHPFLKTDPADLPPPYEEIEWTVRLRAPRRIRSTIGQ